MAARARSALAGGPDWHPPPGACHGCCTKAAALPPGNSCCFKLLGFKSHGSSDSGRVTAAAAVHRRSSYDSADGFCAAGPGYDQLVIVGTCAQMFPNTTQRFGATGQCSACNPKHRLFPELTAGKWFAEFNLQFEILTKTHR